MGIVSRFGSNLTELLPNRDGVDSRVYELTPNHYILSNVTPFKPGKSLDLSSNYSSTLPYTDNIGKIGTNYSFTPITYTDKNMKSMNSVYNVGLENIISKKQPAMSIDSLIPSTNDKSVKKYSSSKTNYAISMTDSHEYKNLF